MKQPVKPTDLLKAKVNAQQYREGYEAGLRWGAWLRPLAAPIRWWRRR